MVKTCERNQYGQTAKASRPSVSAQIYKKKQRKKLFKTYFILKTSICKPLVYITKKEGAPAPSSRE
jgi:hypothetical protein